MQSPTTHEEITMTTYRYADLGARTTRPGEKPGARWSAMFMGGTVQNAVTFEFDEEPEHRALEEIMEHVGADSWQVLPPTAEDDDDGLCPHGWPPEFCGVCHEEDDVENELVREGRAIGRASMAHDEIVVENPCPHCTRGTMYGPNNRRWRCHFCRGTGKVQA